MQTMVKLSFQEIAQIVINHLAQENRLISGVKVDIAWHWDRVTLDGSYAIFEQESND